MVHKRRSKHMVLWVAAWVALVLTAGVAALMLKDFPAPQQVIEQPLDAKALLQR